MDTTGNARKSPETSRTKLKIEFRKECWFDPGQGHHSSQSTLFFLDFLGAFV
jgi:hypothetical protein